METLEFLRWLLASFAGAILAIYIAYSSTVVQDIKKALGLIVGERSTKWKWFTKPFVYVWHKLQDLFNCPYCLSVWICTIINIAFFDMGISEGFLFGLLGIIYVTIWEKITLK